MTNSSASALSLAKLALRGTAIGDGFGQRFFGTPATVASLLEARAMPKPPWRWTDDTAMAISVYEVLRDHSRIDRDALATRFARRYWAEPDRGYGQGAHRILQAVNEGEPWRDAAGSVFGGSGSYGNGAAMRVAPVGAFFWDDTEALVENASASADPTHTHLEGRVGAIAIALAAAYALREREGQLKKDQTLFDFVLNECPKSLTRSGIEAAQKLSLETEVRAAAAELGNGSEISAQDTVPLCIWLLARHLDSFEEAMWNTVNALGDRDTTCAIVGGVVALRVGETGLPAAFADSCEPLPEV